MKTCYYALLGVEQTCSEGDIKKSYRRLALSNHPDKASLNGLTPGEATEKFQALQEAYSVLSDPRERSWYDDHREQILGSADAKENQDPLANLSKYSSGRCCTDFGHGESGFYSVYHELFERLHQQECAKANNSDSDGTLSDAPGFGNSESPWAEVSAFYRNWLDFSSRQSFSFADKCNPNTAENRQARRNMESENKKARTDARKTFNAKIREIVHFAQENDPRVKEHGKVQADEEAQRKAANQAARKRDIEEKKTQSEQRRRKLAPVAKLSGCR